MNPRSVNLLLVVLLLTGSLSYACENPDVYPVAILKAIPSDVMDGQSVTLDGTDSYVTKTFWLTGHITKYQWDFTNNGSYDYEEEEDINEDGDGDGIFGSTTHLYPGPGLYTAKLKVTSSVDGATDTDTCTVNVYVPVTWYVDLDSPLPVPDCNGASWSTAFHTLQDALGVSEYGDQIKVAEGTYYPDQGAGQTPGDRTATFQLVEGVTIEGGYLGYCEPNDVQDFGLYGNYRNVAMYKTTLSGNIADPDKDSDNSYRVVLGVDDAVLDGFTITEGNGTLASGIYCSYVSPTISNCVIIGNKASRYGGGMYTYNYSRGPTVINCFFVDNEGGIGGGIYIGGSTNTVDVTNCIFVGNKATSANRGNGGGIYNRGEVTLVNCTFFGNDAQKRGGGAYNDGDMIVGNSIFWSNTATNSITLELQQIDGDTSDVMYSCIQGLNIYADPTNIGDDPLFQDPTDIYGDDGALNTYDDGLRLLPDSPCIDTGLVDLVQTGILIDIAGYPRTLDGADDDSDAATDMGANESTIGSDDYEFNCQCFDDLGLDTPQFYTVSFSGVWCCPLQFPSVANGTWLLKQYEEPYDACSWVYRSHSLLNPDKEYDWISIHLRKAQLLVPYLRCSTNTTKSGLSERYLAVFGEFGECGSITGSAPNLHDGCFYGDICGYGTGYWKPGSWPPFGN